MMDQFSMYVTKRNGDKEEVSFDKVLKRIRFIVEKKPKLEHVNPFNLAQQVCSRIYDGVKTCELDELASQISASMVVEHPDYGVLSSRISISNHHKNTSPSFSETIYMLYHNKVYGEDSPLVDKKLYDIVMENKNKLNDFIDYERDYLIDYFGFKTLEKAYLMKINGKIVERPQHMIMRVALGIHKDDFKDALNTYDLISKKYFTHATPTLFNSGTPRPQLSSCFLVAMKEDSIDGIYETLQNCANISKWAGGIGLHIHNVRGNGSRIRGSNGTSNGIIPMLRVFNTTARYVNQGGKRNGSIAVYLEPWHLDIEHFIELRKNHGNEEERCRDLFLALWIPDLFMKRVQENGNWTLMCPDKCRGLSDVYGEDFVKLYTQYEKEGKGYRTVKAQQLWFKIIESQIETGTPYILYKDSCNQKSNQKNLGTIKSSNLCTEITLYTDKDETAVCNLASINVNNMLKPTNNYTKNITLYTRSNCKFCEFSKLYLTYRKLKYTEINLDDETIRKQQFEEWNKDIQEEEDKIKTLPQIVMDDIRIGGFDELYQIKEYEFDFEMLYQITKTITKNLNKVIDVNFYPTKEAELSNKRHRPLGIGIQGLADIFCRLKMPFDSPEAMLLNDNIFETIYYASLEESMEISKKREESMKRIKRLKEQNQLTEVEREELDNLNDIYKPIPEELNRDTHLGSYSTFIDSPASKGILQFDMWGFTPDNKRYNWNQLKENIKLYGIRNSMLLAPMPTASTSQILGNNECFEPYTSNIYVRRTIAGDFIRINPYLFNDLISIGIWNKDMKDLILMNNGKIGEITDIPKSIRNMYKTAWEISQKVIIDMASTRGKWICQSQSMNVFMEEPSPSKLTSMHFYAWKKGLKTGMYYLRTQPKVKAQQFTINPDKRNNKINQIKEKEDNECLSCGA